MSNLIDLERLCRLISDSREEKALLTFHSVGDRDGVASAIALSNCFDSSNVVTPDFITKNAKRMLLQAKYSKKIRSDFPSNTEIVIVSDCNNLEALEPFRKKLLEFEGDVIFIDHHAEKDLDLGDNCLVFDDEGYNSSSSIVYEVLKRNNEEISKQTAILLLNGIISDSADFQNTTPLTFKQISELLENAQINYSDVTEYFHEEVSAENRHLLMQDIFSSKTEVIGDYILIYGETSGSASLAAESALRFGADASVFWTIRDKEASISVRLRSPLDQRFHIHLGRTMQDSGKALGGSGGGHPCAAGAYGPNKNGLKDASGIVIGLLRKSFSSQ